MHENLNENYFKTSDLSLIALLQVFGYKIKKIKREETNKVIFFIEKDNKLDSLIQSFWSRSLSVEPLAYFESLKNIKSRIYQ
ncbi:DUF5659 domain-containing protein [Desulfobacter postgatei]|jgi:hypothetical protein|uniref:DUF5659 domain-containing protein n=1 Tax=Desulfobacter postgatei TaxID=2293 RepID=UPI00387E08A7